VHVKEGIETTRFSRLTSSDYVVGGSTLQIRRHQVTKILQNPARSEVKVSGDAGI